MDVLGWRGTLVRGFRVLGVQVDAVVEIDEQAHARRGEPMLDHDTLAMWEWPGSAAPSVTKLVGVLSREPDWRKGLRAVGRMRGFCAGAIVGRDDEACRLECAYFGVSILDADGELIQAGSAERAPRARRRTLDRWVEELAYGRLIDDGVLA
ncbi:hypothetical protein Lesp02_41240 [Lentzea sp. NBRC 105346]|uniref:hypothetical protein n=1 Tax=Lentzea sp. NBRC 105346 TaxID=3032205 RepID=UPI0024A1F6D2|nr:hypothetical protein [Lentzea sp. NBRC 105346]GLZ31936.1 hypothetical protein Lesp02_41240 [Lentzea sp. NBRC 105346]